MCSNTTCPLHWRDLLLLRRMVNDISEECSSNLLERRVEPGYVIYDVCTALSLDPKSVLPGATVDRIIESENVRLWPTLTDAENAEMVELSNIGRSDLSDPISLVPEPVRALDDILK